MSALITIQGVTMSTEAARLVEWTGIDPAEDVRRVRAGLSIDALYAECIDGCDDTEDMAAWRDYVACVASEADMAAWRERRAAERPCQCKCGAWSGESCEAEVQAHAMVRVRFVPDDLRGTAVAARSNAGLWTTIMVAPACAEYMADVDGEWVAS